MAGLSDRSAFEAFDRMADKIEQNERLASANAEVSEELSAGDSLEREFKSLETGDNNADDRLLALKRQMGLLPAAEPAETTELASGEAARQIAAGAQKPPVRDAELLEEFEELERGEAGGTG